MHSKSKKILVGVTGGIFGVLAVLLVKYGNPPNMGFCIACFLRDISGGLGFHQAAPVQNVRPEILGLVLGGFAAAVIFRQYKTVGGSSPVTRFFLAFVGMIGMLVFLGCPVRAVLRLAGGDLNAVIGLIGLVVGIWIGVYFLSNGFTMGRAYPQNNINGYVFPGLALIITLLVLFSSNIFYASPKGPGTMFAPVILSLAAGLIVGFLAQRSSFCMIGGIRDFILFRDTYLLIGFFSFLVVAFIGNLFTGAVSPGFIDQPVAHADGLWNFLGMAVAGISLTLLGGCPLRQLIAAGEGNTDCVVTVLGFLAGAAFAHNFGLAASPKGVPIAGQWATVIGLLFILGIGYIGSRVVVPGKGGVNVERSS
ncbi:MAG: YedE-related selenium metabolism membrane protein [Clostridiales bacterium]|nr:YedE-related selenium metabolism membrane protein [Clostridiales bacterium]MCF8022002.1 YedE-related selenium metabolism membrane protein [Clostridiales bacterium]